MVDLKRITKLFCIGLLIFGIIYLFYLILLHGLDIKFFWRSQENQWDSVNVFGLKINALELILKKFPETRQVL